MIPIIEPVVFSAGSVERTVRVELIDDGEKENTESFDVYMKGASSNVRFDHSDDFQIVIFDNDG